MLFWSVSNFILEINFIHDHTVWWETCLRGHSNMMAYTGVTKKTSEKGCFFGGGQVTRMTRLGVKKPCFLRNKGCLKLNFSQNTRLGGK